MLVHSTQGIITLMKFRAVQSCWYHRCTATMNHHFDMSQGQNSVPLPKHAMCLAVAAAIRIAACSKRHTCPTSNSCNWAWDLYILQLFTLHLPAMQRRGTNRGFIRPRRSGTGSPVFRRHPYWEAQLQIQTQLSSGQGTYLAFLVTLLASAGATRKCMMLCPDMPAQSTLQE